jgi:hypothetical protein
MLDAPQLDLLYDLALNAPDGAACEVGVYTGGGLALIEMVRRGRGTVYGVDNWTWGNQGDRLRAAADQNLVALGCRVELLTMTSRQAAAEVPDGLALVHVDADHGLGGIDLDIRVWPQKVAVGGTIAFHDYGMWKCPLVQASVDKWRSAAWEQIALVGSLIAFRRVA